MIDDAVFNELIDAGVKLKSVLKDGYFTAEQPMNVVVDEDTYFDVWLDGEDQIQTGHLYTHEEYWGI